MKVEPDWSRLVPPSFLDHHIQYTQYIKGGVAAYWIHFHKKGRVDILSDRWNSRDAIYC